MGFGSHNTIENTFDVVENYNDRVDHRDDTTRLEVVVEDWEGECEDREPKAHECELPPSPVPKRYQEVQFGYPAINSYGSGKISIETKDLIFKKCHTFGYKASKFSGSDGSISLCLSSEQLGEFNHIIESCRRYLKNYWYRGYTFKKVLYGNKIYVKADSKFTQRVTKNTKVDVRIRVESLYVSGCEAIHLQLRLVNIS